MKKIKMLLTTALCAGVILGATACGKKKNKVVIGFTYFAPIAYEDENKKLTGFDVELAKAVFKEIDKTYGTTTSVEFQEIEWDAKETLLKNGTIDLVWNGLTITEERKQNMEISIPYLNNEQVCVIKKADSAKYTDATSFSNAVCTVESGSAGEDCAKEQKDAGRVKEVIAVESQLDALNKLKDGNSDVAVIDSVMAGYYTTTSSLKDSLMIVNNLVLATEQYGIAAKKGNSELINKINLALRAIKDTEFKTLADAYGLTDYIAVK